MATSSFFQGDWETRAGSGHSLGPAGCGADSPGAVVVPGLWFQWGAAGSPIADMVSFLLSLALVLREFRRWKKGAGSRKPAEMEQTTPRRPILGQRGVRLFMENGAPSGAVLLVQVNPKEMVVSSWGSPARRRTCGAFSRNTGSFETRSGWPGYPADGLGASTA